MIDAAGNVVRKYRTNSSILDSVKIVFYFKTLYVVSFT